MQHFEMWVLFLDVHALFVSIAADGMPVASGPEQDWIGHMCDMRSVHTNTHTPKTNERVNPVIRMRLRRAVGAKNKNHIFKWEKNRLQK